MKKRGKYILIATAVIAVLLVASLLLDRLPGKPLPWLINLTCFLGGAIPLCYVLVNRKASPLIWIFVFLFFLGGLELGLRVGVYEDRFYTIGMGKHYSPHPLLFWTQKSMDRVAQKDSLDGHLNQWNGDQKLIDNLVGENPPALDFRSGPVSQEKHPDGFRIITMGGSIAYGYGIENYKDTFSGRLIEMIRKEYPYLPIELISAGQPGYGMFQNLVLYKIYLRNYKPDLIVLYTNANDLFQHLGPYTYREYFYKRTGVDIGRLWIDRFEFPQKQNWVLSLQDQLRKLHLYNWATSRIVGFRDDAIMHRIGDNLLKEVNPVGDYRKNLEDLIAIVEKDEAKILLADPFYYRHAVSQTNDEAKNLIRNTMAKTATEQRVPFVPVHQILATQADPDKITFENDREHLNEEGHRLVADILFAAIKENRLLEQ